MRRGRLALAIHLLSLAVSAALLLSIARDQWFFGDEWDFLVHRDLQHGLRPLFAPHNEHWSTIPILVYRGLFAAVGVRSYLPYLAVLFGLHALATHLLWRVMQRAGVSPGLATGLAAVFAVLGVGHENLLWAFQIGFVGSFTLGLAQLLLVDHDGPYDRRDLMGSLVGGLGLLFSGIGVTMVATAAIATGLRRGARIAILTAAPQAALFLVWLAAIGREGLGTHETSSGTLLRLHAYVLTGLSHALGSGVGAAAAGTLLVAGLATWMVLCGREQRASLAAAMAAGAVVLYLVSGVGRVALGVNQAEAPRYAYLAFGLLLPAVGLVLSDLANRIPGIRLAVIAVPAIFLVHNAAGLTRAASIESQRELSSRNRILAGAVIAGLTPGMVGAVPDPAHAEGLSVPALLRLRQDGKLPSAAVVTDADRRAAATFLLVTRSSVPQFPRTSTAISLDGAQLRRVGACAEVSASPTGGGSHLRLRLSEPSSVRVVPTSGTPPALLLATNPGGRPPSPLPFLPVEPHEDRWVNVGSRTAEVTLVLPHGSTARVCGVAWPS